METSSAFNFHISALTVSVARQPYHVSNIALLDRVGYGRCGGLTLTSLCLQCLSEENGTMSAASPSVLGGQQEMDDVAV